MLYLIVIFGAMALIILVNVILNSLLYNLDFWYIVLAVVSSTALAVLISAIVAFFVRQILPEKLFDANRMDIKVSKKEIRFYEKIGVKKWKDLVPELGFFAGFRKNKIENPKSIEYVDRFILEINYGIYVHLVSVFTSFLVVLIYPLKYCLMFGIPVAIVSVILHLMPLFSLRYNLPKLKTIKKILINKKLKSN